MEYYPSEDFDFHGRNDIVEELSKSHKAVELLLTWIVVPIVQLQSRGKLAMQRLTPARTRKIDFAKQVKLLLLTH